MRMRVVALVLVLLLLLSVPFAMSSGSKGIKIKEEKVTVNLNLSCLECHGKSEIYPKHVNGYTYCYNCHGSDVHPIHTFDCKTCHQNDPLTPLCHGPDPDVVIPTAEGVICKACHDGNLVVVHENCQDCHRGINEIHKKADVVGGVGNV